MDTPSHAAANARRQVLYLTRSPFWRCDDGDRMRNLSLVWVLDRLTELTIVYVGTMSDTDRSACAALGLGARFHALTGRVDHASALALVAERVQERRFDLAVFARLQLDFLRQALPSGCVRLIDTHDLLSDNAESRRRVGLAPFSALDLDQELALLSQYHGVMLIQARDHARVQTALGARALLVPHAVRFSPRPVRPASNVLGYVAGRWEANLDAMRWFMREIWPVLRPRGVQLHVAGRICEAMPELAGTDVVLRGFVPDPQSLWADIDVAINPVRWGSGLKIKNVEALGNGLPLVTTAEGARGLEAGVGRALLIEDSAEGFAAACIRLLDDPALRAQMASQAHALAGELFSAQRCWQPLLNWLAALP